MDILKKNTLAESMLLQKSNLKKLMVFPIRIMDGE